MSKVLLWSFSHSALTLFILQSCGTLITGMVGPDDGGMTVEAANEAARHCALNIISTLKIISVLLGSALRHSSYSFPFHHLFFVFS